MDIQEKLIDAKTVEDFGQEWNEYDQQALDNQERFFLWQKYFSIFPWDLLPKNAVGMDVGCGSGRWAVEVAPKIGRLLCVDASSAALNVAKKNLAHHANCEFHVRSVGDLPAADNSLDFIYSLGVLHHIPDTAAAIKACTQKLKSGAPFLVYLYYRFDNRPIWYYWLWKLTDFFRKGIATLPFFLKKNVCLAIAAFIYFPLAKMAKGLSLLGYSAKNFPLSSYKDCSFYSMKTDALDRFGTGLEHRFTKQEIAEMLASADLKDIRFSESFPFWCAVGTKI